MTISLPQAKLLRLQELIASWRYRTSCTKHDLDSLIGQLQHASAVVKPGRSFLRRMIVLSKSRKHPSHYLRLNCGFQADLSWWHMFLGHWNGISMMSAIGISSPSFTVTSDASGSWGYGAHFASHWFQLKWDPFDNAHSIAFLELVPIIIAGMVWGKLWKGSHVCCRCDNQAVVAIIHSRYSRDDKLMHLLRCLFFVEAFFNFSFIAEHVPARVTPLLILYPVTMITPLCCRLSQWTPTPLQFSRKFPRSCSTRRWTGYSRLGRPCSILF